MRLIGSILLLAALGCAGPAPRAAGEGPGAPADAQPISLFPSDAEVLSDEAITKILDAKARLPQRLRVALLHIEHRSAGRFWGWGPDWTALGPSAQQQVSTALIRVLQDSPRVRSASSLPTFLLPEKPTVGHLREAAARFQADALLIYRTDCQAYERNRIFHATEAKAFCSAEAALLDVRSGIVPFTTRTLRDFTVAEQSSDAGFLETVRNAETQAFTAALEENARALVAFLAGP